MCSGHHNVNLLMLSTDNLSRPHDLDLGPTRTNVANSTSTHDGKQLCKFIYESIQNFRSNGLDINLNFKCDLDLGPT